MLATAKPRQPKFPETKAQILVSTPNAFAYLMIALWPFVTWAMWRHLDAGRALIWTILAGYLALPPLTALNLPLIPDLDKVSIPNLMALFCAVYLLKDRISFLPNGILGKILILFYVLSPFGTVLTNDDPLIFEQATIQGMRIYDSVAAVANQAIALLPFFLARRYLGTPEGIRAILVALIFAGLVYSVPMVIESQLSPQLNVWIYGFFQHDFFQTIRQGGYRPVVFLPHGLWVAFFALMCMLSATILLRSAAPEARPKAVMVLAYLFAMVLVSKSAGPLVYAFGAAPLILFASPRVQIAVAVALATIVMIYPLLRGAHLVPLDDIMAIANGVSPERAASLQFRIDNEELLLARGQERPWFGWGGYGRSFVHDPVYGKIVNIADGAWIIVLGIYGWIGYLAEFGLTALPLFLLGREVLLQDKANLSPYVAGLALILAANMVDLLPNATHIPFTWLISGALLGEVERLVRLRKAGAAYKWQQNLHVPSPKRTII